MLPARIVPVPSIAASVDARVLSSMKDERTAASAILAGPQPRRYEGSVEQLVAKVHDALYASKVCAYAQGMHLLAAGSKEFNCVGALPPQDHPHIYLDMGDDTEIICSYCSTLYRHDPTLDPHTARPPDCALPDAA